MGTLWADRLADGDPAVGDLSLLAALIRRPSLISLVAEELAHLVLQNQRYQALRAAMLGWAMGTIAGSNAQDSSADMADSSQIPDEAIEKAGFLAHLGGLGLSAVAQQVLAATAEPTGDKASLAGAANEWRHAAARHGAQIGRAAMVAEAEKAWAESPTEENWQRLQALIEQNPPASPAS
jgi:hypothetical protein